MRSPLKIKSRRGRPTAQPTNTEGRRSAPQASCWVKRLYQGGFLSYEALQAAYRFSDLRRHYVWAIEGPRPTRSRNLEHTLRRCPLGESRGVETDTLLKAWQATSQILKKMGAGAENLLQQALGEEERSWTYRDALRLKQILSALMDFYEEEDEPA